MASKVPSITQQFSFRYSIPLDHNQLSPQRRVELRNWDYALLQAFENKRRRTLVFAWASLFGSFSFLLALAGLHFFWFFVLAGAGTATWGFKPWRKSINNLNHQIADSGRFVDYLFKDINEIYEAKKAHGRL